jgi:hypothetical protein
LQSDTVKLIYECLLMIMFSCGGGGDGINKKVHTLCTLRKEHDHAP